MSSLLHNIKRAKKGAAIAADIAVWAGHWGVRQYKAGSAGICLVCNNLQPYGHEDTIGRTGAAWLENMFEHRALSNLPSHPTGGGVALEIKNIPITDIINVRDVDEQTGQMKRTCRYCFLLCEIFDAFFIDEYENRYNLARSGLSLTVSLIIQEGRPLVVQCIDFLYKASLGFYRVDMEIYCDFEPGHTPQLQGLPCLAPTGIRSESVASDACQAFIRECVRQCCAEHGTCATHAAATGSFVPTRLLYLGRDNEELRVCENVGINGAVA